MITLEKVFTEYKKYLQLAANTREVTVSQAEYAASLALRAEFEANDPAFRAEHSLYIGFCSGYICAMAQIGTEVRDSPLSKLFLSQNSTLQHPN